MESDNTELDKTVRWLLKNDPNFTKQRRWQLLVFFIRNLLDGMQYSIIIPTGWAYAKSFGVQPWFYSLVICAYPLSGALASPLAGIFFDRYKITREITSVCTILEMLGSIIYAMPTSAWLLFGGRLVSGFGSANLGILNSEIALITTKEERLGVFAKMAIATLVGMFYGPGIAYSLKWVDFSVADWKIKATNAPGVLCFITWSLFQVLTTFKMRNMAKELPNYEIGEMDEREEEAPEETNTRIHLLKNTGHLAKPSTEAEDEVDGCHVTEPSVHSIGQLIKESFTHEVAFVIFSLFAARVFMNIGDVTVSLFTQEDFGWPPVLTSLTFVILALEASIVMVAIDRLSRFTTDEVVLAIGLCCNFVSTIFWLVYGWTRNSYTDAVSVFMFTSTVGVIGYASVHVSATSLISKILPPSVQGAAQTGSVIITRIAYVIGPLCGSILFNHIYAGYSIFGISFLILFIWGLCSIPSLRVMRT